MIDINKPEDAKVVEEYLHDLFVATKKLSFDKKDITLDDIRQLVFGFIVMLEEGKKQIQPVEKSKIITKE